jgi:hypothetical protein
LNRGSAFAKATADRLYAFETRSFPNSLAAAPRGFAFYLTVPISSIETRSLPNSLAAAPRGFAFYVADPSAPFTEDSEVSRQLAAILVFLGHVTILLPFWRTLSTGKVRPARRTYKKRQRKALDPHETRNDAKLRKK